MENLNNSPFPLIVDLSFLTGIFLLGSLLETVHILCRVSHSNAKHSCLMFCQDKLFNVNMCALKEEVNFISFTEPL